MEGMLEHMRGLQCLPAPSQREQGAVLFSDPVPDRLLGGEHQR